MAFYSLSHDAVTCDFVKHKQYFTLAKNFYLSNTCRRRLAAFSSRLARSANVCAGCDMIAGWKIAPQIPRTGYRPNTELKDPGEFQLHFLFLYTAIWTEKGIHLNLFPLFYLFKNV